METDAREGAFRFLCSSVHSADVPGERLASELGYGVLRHRARLDWIAEKLSGRRRSRIDPSALQILRLGLYQLLFMPSIPAYAAVSESVSLARKVVPRAKGFVNLVLRRVGPETGELPRRGDIPDECLWLATFYSFPLWMVRRWRRRFGLPETERLLIAMNTFPPLDLRVNPMKGEMARIVEEVRERGGTATAGTYSPTALHVSGVGKVTTLPSFLQGGFYIQDESSQLAAHAMIPGPGERILDACAGVGGKSTHLAEITGDRSEVVAVDPDPVRLDRCRENAARLGLRSVVPRLGDILDESFDPRPPFDRILVDAPCSGLGIIRRHPELKWKKRASDPARLQRLQLQLLLRASQWLRPGGLLAYSTCTMEPEENEETVHRFLKQKPRFHIVPPPPSGNDNFDRLLTPEGFIAPLPHRHKMNGGFVALLKG